MTRPRQPTPDERHLGVALPLDPEVALRALLKVDPDAPAAAAQTGEEPSSRTEQD